MQGLEEDVKDEDELSLDSELMKNEREAKAPKITIDPSGIKPQDSLQAPGTEILSSKTKRMISSIGLSPKQQTKVENAALKS